MFTQRKVWYKNYRFLDVTPRNVLIVYHHYGATCHIHVQDRSVSGAKQ
jgi:hypothetical protein